MSGLCAPSGAALQPVACHPEQELVASLINVLPDEQPANYMLPLKLRPVFERGVFELSWSLERRQSLVDLGDVADVASMVLTDSERHAGATYELVAPGRYTAHDLGDIISRVHTCARRHAASLAYATKHLPDSRD